MISFIYVNFILYIYIYIYIYEMIYDNYGGFSKRFESID